MKKVFNNLLLIFISPFRFIRKSKIDNFVGGLIFGAFFSLVVNVVTVQIQENIQRQRTYEAIEREVMGNLVMASQTLDRNKALMENLEPINVFYVSADYSDDFWSQSSEAISYVAQLDRDTQSHLLVYYTNTIRNANLQTTKANKLIDEFTIYCYENLTAIPAYKTDECKVRSYMIYLYENLAAEQVLKESDAVLNVFTPTKNRVSSRYLKLLMGDIFEPEIP